MCFKRLLIYLISTALITVPLTPPTMAHVLDEPQASPVPGSPVERDQYVQQMNRMSAFMQKLRANLDRTAFDFDELVFSLNFDPEEIIEFSKTSIAYEQYPGVLRGAKGALLSRAGNSIDQSLLLARLLRDAGYDARIAGAELQTVAAKSVLQAMKQPVKPAPPFGDAEAISNLLEHSDLFEVSLNEEQKKAYADFVSTPPSAKESDVYPTVEATTDFIISQLNDTGVKFADSGKMTDLVEEARQYYWVQFRDQVAGPWTDVHPIFIDEPPFETPEESTYITEAVPESLQHKLKFQVFIERRTGNQLEVVPITTPWERPVANLVGVPLTFSNVSDEMLDTASLRRDFEDLLNSSSFFAPTFGNSLAEGAQFFDLRGTLIDPMAAQSGAADLFATIGNAFTGALDEFDAESAIPTLTAQWLEFTLISPDGNEQAFRRTTIDRIGAAARKNNNVPVDLEPTVLNDVRTLMQRQTFMIANGSVPRGYVLESAISRFESARPGIDALMDLHYDKPASAEKLAQIPVGWPDHLALFAMFDMAGALSSDHRNYRSGPALVIHNDGLGRNDTWIESVDIVNNPRRAVNIHGNVPALDPEYAVRAGVWETAVEGMFLSNVERFDTWRSFKAAEKSGVEPVVLLPGQPKPQVDLSADTHAAIDFDLERGYAVIIPSVQDPSEAIGWWRTDLQTGETLGQLRDGRGASATEQALLMLISSAFLTYSLKACTDKTETSSDLAGGICCVFINVGMSAGFAAVIGIKYAEAFWSLRAGASIAGDVLGAGTPAAEICGL